MTDLLLLTKNLLKDQLELANINVIPHVELLPLESGFPAIGIMDGGDQVEPGASEGIRKHQVLIAVYDQVVGDRELSMLNIRTYLECIKNILEDIENFYSNGPMAGYNGCRYKRSSESRPLQYIRNEDEKSYVVIKLGIFEFKETYISI